MFWINLIAFQVCWAACVWGGARGYWWLGPAAVTLFLVWELIRAHAPTRTLALVAIAAVIGFLIDSAYIKAGLLRYASPVPWAQWAPVWIVAMWIGFTLTLNVSLAWLQKHTLAAVLLGAIGGPFAYWIAAVSWNAAEFIGATPLSLAVIGVVWAVATPGLLWLARRIDPQPLESLA